MPKPSPGGTWTESDDIAAVINSRIRRRAGILVPLPAPAWSDQVPEVSDPERAAYLTEVAALMDARKERIGEHAAATALPWAVAALGEVPADPEARLEWQRRAASVGAYRELSGYDDPADPVGPEPAANNPDLRAAWHEALAALGPVDGPDVRGMTDGLLLRLRDTYPAETAWAPPWTGDELRQARAAIRDAHLAALRATAEASAARRRGERKEARRQQSLAASYQAIHDAYRPSPRSPRRRGSWNGSPSGTWTGNPAADRRAPVRGTGRAGHRAAEPGRAAGGPGCPFR